MPKPRTTASPPMTPCLPTRSSPESPLKPGPATTSRSSSAEAGAGRPLAGAAERPVPFLYAAAHQRRYADTRPLANVPKGGSPSSMVPANAPGTLTT